MGLLRDLRDAAVMSQTMLATAAGVSVATVARAEAGTGPVRASTLALLAKALGVDVRVLRPLMGEDAPGD